MKLSLYAIECKPKYAIKAQTLVNLLAENASRNKSHSFHRNTWNLYVDRSSIKDNNGASVIIETHEGEKHELTYSSSYLRPPIKKQSTRS